MGVKVTFDRTDQQGCNFMKEYPDGVSFKHSEAFSWTIYDKDGEMIAVVSQILVIERTE